MIAARLHAYGQPMTLDHIDVPEPRPTDVLVEVDTCMWCQPRARREQFLRRKLTPDNKMMPPLPAIFGLRSGGRGREVGGG